MKILQIFKYISFKTYVMNAACTILCNLVLEGLEA